MSDWRSVTVITASGDVSTALGPNHHVQTLLAEVLARLEYPLSYDASEYTLVNEDGEPLDELHTVGGAGIEDGDTLHLDVNPSGGI